MHYMKLNTPTQRLNTKKPIIVGFFVQYVKLRMLDPYYNFFSKFCDMNKFEELDMDTDSLRCSCPEGTGRLLRPKIKAEWEHLPSQDGLESFLADAVAIFFPEGAVTSIEIMTRESQDSSKKNSNSQRSCAYVAKLTAAMMLPKNTINSVVKI